MGLDGSQEYIRYGCVCVSVCALENLLQCHGKSTHISCVLLCIHAKLMHSG